MRQSNVIIREAVENIDKEGIVKINYADIDEVKGILIPLSNKEAQETYGFREEVSFLFVYKNRNKRESLKIENMIEDYRIVEVLYYPGKATICGLEGG